MMEKETTPLIDNYLILQEAYPKFKKKIEVLKGRRWKSINSGTEPFSGTNVDMVSVSCRGTGVEGTTSH